MTTPAMFEQSIREAGVDDAGPYLVYADWLQERGDALGRLIVIMHAREHADSPALADEERALFEAHLASWLGPAYMPHQAGELELTWRCGLVAAARIRKLDPQSPDDPLAILRALVAQSAAHVMTRVTIELASFRTEWRTISDGVLAALPHSVGAIGLGHERGAPAALQLLAIPPGGGVTNLAIGGHVTLHPDRRFSIGRHGMCDLVCAAPGLGGHRNCIVHQEDGRWMVQHLGHGRPIAINGRVIRGAAVLCHGDRIEPAPGLVFRIAIDGEPGLIPRPTRDQPGGDPTSDAGSTGG